MENIIVDFTGFQIGDIYIMREFGIAYVRDTLILVEDPMIIDTKSLLIPSQSLYSSIDFRNFYDKCSITCNKEATHLYSDLASTVRSLLRDNVYVRDASQADILTRYLKLEINPFKLLTDLDFSVREQIMGTSCRNHQYRNSYCVGDNLRSMAAWLKGRLAELSRLEANLAVISFELSESGINALHVCCFSKRGIVAYNKPIALVTVYDSENVTDQYKRSYHNTYGVAWNKQNLKISGMKSILNDILTRYSIEFIFVKSSAHKNFLRNLISASFRIVALDSYGYAEKQGASREEGNRNMVNWILQQKLYQDCGHTNC